MPELVSKRDQMETVRDLLKQYQPQLTAALPIHKKRDAERMARIVLTEIARNPRLLECSPQSLMGAILQAAAFGLEPGIMGDCWLIPYHNRKKNTTDCQFQLGYKGLLKLCRRSGEIGSVQARVVHEKDTFEYAFGLKPKLEHVPSASEEAGEVRYIYAVIHLKDGTAMFDVWTKGQIDAHRKRYSQSPDSGPWMTAWDEMAKKTVLLRVCKLAPASVELQTAIALDELAEVGEPQDLAALVEPDAPATPGKLDKLTDELKKNGEQSSAAGSVPGGGDPPKGETQAPASPPAAETSRSAVAERAGTTTEPGKETTPPATAGKAKAAPPAPAQVKADRGEPAVAGPGGVFNRSAMMDHVTTLFEDLKLSKLQREFMWNRFVGQGVKVEDASEEGLRKLARELEALKAKREKK